MILFYTLLVFIASCIFVKSISNTESFSNYPIYPGIHQYFDSGIRYDDERNMKYVQNLPPCVMPAPASEQCISSKLYETGDIDYANYHCSRPVSISESCFGSLY